MKKKGKRSKKLFEKARLAQWHPETGTIAEIIRRIESQPKIPASQVANIDLECTFFSREVLQIDIADMEENNVIGYFPWYSKGIVASFSLALPPQPTWH